MNLTGKQLVEQKIITGKIREENVQPNSVDLNLLSIHEVSGRIGFIPDEGKTLLGQRIMLQSRMHPDPRDETKMIKGWKLSPGVFELTLTQGCKVPASQRLRIIHRSSIVRNGGIIVSGIFDSGFITENMGAMLYLDKSLLIEEGSRVATVYTTATNEVEKLYDGQWQGDKQREKKNG